MKAWGWVPILLLTGSMASAQSLGEVAERERERREKDKQAGAKPKVIDSDGLATRTGKDAKGTFNPVAGSTRGGTGAASPAPASSPPTTTTMKEGGRTDVDRQRAAAMESLVASYAAIAATARDFLQVAQHYNDRCAGGSQATTDSCLALGRTADRLAIAVADAMTQAEDAARQGWLPPGEVRAVRQRFNMDQAWWDELVRLVRQHRR